MRGMEMAAPVEGVRACLRPALLWEDALGVS